MLVSELSGVNFLSITSTQPNSHLKDRGPMTWIRGLNIPWVDPFRPLVQPSPSKWLFFVAYKWGGAGDPHDPYVTLLPLDDPILRSQPVQARSPVHHQRFDLLVVT